MFRETPPVLAPDSLRGAPHDLRDVEKVTFAACAHLGSGLTEFPWEPDRNAFVLRVGNNDISPEGEGCQTVRKLGVKVEEAETSPSLARRWAPDRTCGIESFAEHLGRMGSVLRPIASFHDFRVL